MAARLAALLAGDKPQRVAAYEELTALANGDGAEQTTHLAVASVHVGGLEGEQSVWFVQLSSVPAIDESSVPSAGQLKAESPVAAAPHRA